MYNKLFTKILDSSIWLESTPTRIVWITFLAMMDQDGTVPLSSIGNVANRARVTEQEAIDAIACLESPDRHNPDQDNDGRRIERIPGIGWFVLNAGKYRDIMKAETVRAQNRERVREYRARQCNAPVTVCNENVTLSETETKAKAKTHTEAASPPVREIFIGTVVSNIAKRKGIKKFPGTSQSEWTAAAEFAFDNGFTQEEFLECFDLLGQQEWRNSPVRGKHVAESLPDLQKLRKEINKQRPPADDIPTLEEKLKADEEYRKNAPLVRPPTTKEAMRC